MQAIAEEMALVIAHLRVTVAIDFIGDPVRASEARMSVDCTLADGRDPSELIESAKAATTIGNSLQGAFPYTLAVPELQLSSATLVTPAE
jgi:hypothetical protein